MKPRSIVFSTALLVSAICRPPALLGQDYVFQTIDFPGASDTLAYAINDHGVIVGEYGPVDFEVPTLPSTHGFLYDGVSFETIDYPDAFSTTVSGINEIGHMVGSYVDSEFMLHGFVLIDGQFQDIVFPGAEATTVSGINNQGDIVGTYSNDNFVSDSKGFSRINGQFSTIEKGKTTFAYDINDSQQIVGTYVTDGLLGDEILGFILDGGNMQDVAHPDVVFPFEVTRTFAISNEGTLAGTFLTVDVDAAVVFTTGYTFDGESFTNIDLPGPDCAPLGRCLRAVDGINSAGTIVGFYDNDDSVYHGFIGLLPQDGDFNLDGRIDDIDIDLLSEAIRSNSSDPQFDLNASGAVDSNDHDFMITVTVGTLPGDGNLDRNVDVSDFNLWNDGKNEVGTGWATGDYDGSGATDAMDFQIWNSNRFMSYNQAASVPEPSSQSIVILILGLCSHIGMRNRRKDYS